MPWIHRRSLAAVRQDLLAEGIVYDAALVTLEMVVLDLEDGRTGAVKELAAEIVAVFEGTEGPPRDARRSYGSSAGRGCWRRRRSLSFKRSPRFWRGPGKRPEAGSRVLRKRFRVSGPPKTAFVSFSRSPVNARGCSGPGSALSVNVPRSSVTVSG